MKLSNKVDLATSMYNPKAYALTKKAYKDGYEQGYALGEIIANSAIESLQKKNDELKAELKKIRCAYITEKVGNLCSGVDTDNLFQSAK